MTNKLLRLTAALVAVSALNKMGLYRRSSIASTPATRFCECKPFNTCTEVRERHVLKGGHTQKRIGRHKRSSIASTPATRFCECRPFRTCRSWGVFRLIRSQINEQKGTFYISFYIVSGSETTHPANLTCRRAAHRGGEAATRAACMRNCVGHEEVRRVSS